MAKPKKPTKSCSQAGSKLATEHSPKAASKLAKCGKPTPKKPARKGPPTKKQCQAAAWSLGQVESKPAGKTMSACAKKAAKRKPVSTGADRIGTLESDTSILPYVVAETVVDEVVSYLAATGHDALSAQVRADSGAAATELTRTAERVYRADEKFRKKMRSKSNAGRDQLYVWMRHWLAARLKREIGAAYSALPRSYDVGRALPEVKVAPSKAAAKPTRAKPGEKKARANRARLELLVGGFVMKHGGRLVREGGDILSPEYVLPTTLGDLTVSVSGDWIHCRFHDVARAVKVIGAQNMNPYSGKWNHGCGERAQADYLFPQWEREVERIMPPHLDRKDNPSGDFRRDLEEFFRPRTGALGRLVASKTRAMDSTGQEGLAWTLHDPRAAAAFYNASADARRLVEELATVASRHGLRAYATDARSIRFYELGGRGRTDNPSRVWLFDAGEAATPRYTMIDTDVYRENGVELRTVIQWRRGDPAWRPDVHRRALLDPAAWRSLGDCSSLGARIRPADIHDRDDRDFAATVLRAWSAKPSDTALPSGFRGELETLLRSRLGSFGQFRDIATLSKQHDVDPTVEVILEDQALGRAILREDGVEQEVEALARRHGLRYEQSSARVHLFHRDGARRDNPGGLLHAPSEAAYARARYALRVRGLGGWQEVADLATAVYGNSRGVYGAGHGDQMEFRFADAASLQRGYALLMEDVRRHNRQVSWSARELGSGRSLIAELAGRVPWPQNLR